MVRQIRPVEVAKRQANGEAVYFVDVRQPWEYETAQIPGSVLIPLNELPARLDEVTPPDGALTVVLCHHGIRSLSGAALLEQAGITNVASLAGGIELWSLTVDPAVPRY